MAADLNIDELRSLLSSRKTVRSNAFALLKAISRLTNTPETEAVGREMVLRALEQREEFSDLSEILNSLVRNVGLYPYAESEALGLRDLMAYEFHRPANMEEDIVFHREQAEVYRRLMLGDSVILSAPTSFGKSRIIDAMIASGKFQNIAVIVPTLALIDETRRRLSTFSKTYKLITHLSQKPGDRNLFVFTAERAVAYENLPPIHFFVVDEFYKIGALEEDESRTIALNQAFYKLLKGGGQFYLLGPNIHQVPDGLERKYRCYFFPTNYSTVVVETKWTPGIGKDNARLIALLRTLDEPTLIFCSSPDRANKVARAMIEAQCGVAAPSLQPAADWISKTYHPEWVLVKGLVNGIGVHHGRLPRSLAQFIVRAFNDDRLRFLICTSTLIEGVNTKAKNVVIWDNTIAKRPLDFFTFNNIRGRSGRMFEHFVGRVFLFEEAPQEELPFVDFPLFTQSSSTPTEILIQMDEADLTDRSKDRLKKYSTNPFLPIDVMRTNKSIDPEAQLTLAQYIEENVATIWKNLAWTSFPKYPELKFACELIWKFLVGSASRHGVFSGSQLTLKTWQLLNTRSTANRIRSELTPGKYAAKSPDEAVERVLAFDRNWAGFDLPRLLMGLSNIQEVVLARNGLPVGDYSSFSAQVESLFRAPVLIALDEYGIPIEVGEKIQAYLRTKEDLDIALKALRNLDLQNIKLAPFERELMDDAKAGL